MDSCRSYNRAPFLNPNNEITYSLSRCFSSRQAIYKAMNTLLLDVPKEEDLPNYQTTKKCLISSSCFPRALLVIVLLRSFL